MRRSLLALGFVAALAWAQFREEGVARLEVATQPLMPARVYLFKDDRPFRLSPVDAMLPLRTDLFYRERLWRRAADPNTFEVTCNDISHFFLLKGRAGFDLPAGKYRIEAYRGLFYKPASVEFVLKAGETAKIALPMDNWVGTESAELLTSDDHIHLVRAPEDDALFLSWMEAEDLSVGNFLQLQRQMDAASQYGFGPKAEAKRAGRSIRSGHESRSEFFGHVNLLGGREIVRPLSIGTVYANSPETFPNPFVLFERGRKVGALTGFAHFDGSQKHSELLMDLTLGALDFVEMFQFGRLRTDDWYELLNAGLRVTGVAGSDFPVHLNTTTRQKEWSRWIPLLGPERMVVKARAGASAYEAWAQAVKRGEGFVSNGPLVDVQVKGDNIVATSRFFRALDKLEIVMNGSVIASATSGATLRAEAQLPASGPVWVMARTSDSTGLQAQTNPVYVRWDGTAPVPAHRQALAKKWETQVDYYRTAPLIFPNEAERRLFFERAEKALKMLQGTAKL
jgi:hypothetical protein